MVHRHLRMVWGAFALIALVFILMPLAIAGDVYTARSESGDSFRLFDEPCDVATGWLKLQKAEVRYKGKDYKACWALFKTMVVILDDAGDLTPIPMQAFSKEQVI